MKRLTLISKLVISGLFWLSTISANCLGSTKTQSHNVIERNEPQQPTSIFEVLKRNYQEQLDYYSQCIPQCNCASFADMYNLKGSTENAIKNNISLYYNPFPIIDADYVSTDKDRDGNYVVKKATAEDFFPLLKRFFPELLTLYIYTRKDLDFVLENLDHEYIKNLKNGIRIELNKDEKTMTFSEYYDITQVFKYCNLKVIFGENNKIILTQDDIQHGIGFRLNNDCLFIDDAVTEIGDKAFADIDDKYDIALSFMYAKNLQIMHKDVLCQSSINLLIAPKLQKITGPLAIWGDPACVFAPNLQELNVNGEYANNLLIYAENLKIINPDNNDQRNYAMNFDTHLLNTSTITEAGQRLLDWTYYDIVFDFSSLTKLNRIFPSYETWEIDDQLPPKNSCKYLIFRDLECINSEQALTELPMLEKIILIDNGSNGRTLETIKTTIMENEFNKDLPVVQKNNIEIMTQEKYEEWLKTDEGKEVRDQFTKKRKYRKAFYALFREIENKINTNQEITKKDLDQVYTKCDKFYDNTENKTLDMKILTLYNSDHV